MVFCRMLEKSALLAPRSPGSPRRPSLHAAFSLRLSGSVKGKTCKAKRRTAERSCSETFDVVTTNSIPDRGEIYERVVAEVTLEAGRPCFSREKQGLPC